MKGWIAAVGVVALIVAVLYAFFTWLTWDLEYPPFKYGQRVVVTRGFMRGEVGVIDAQSHASFWCVQFPRTYHCFYKSYLEVAP